MLMKQKRKILNDPIYGFIDIPNGFLFEIIEHPYFQRLRRIVQLGLTNMVYPGAIHTRFQHALGATHLISSAIEVIRAKGHKVTEEEKEAAMAAILLHDIGHGPYSHTLEQDIVEKVNHEDISLFFIDRLNDIFQGRLAMAKDIFTGAYPKKFLHQLISSQLDVDRLDYLKRDSFFTGVSEGVIGTERILKMLDVYDDQLVVESKGIYSIEKFLIARRLMYWQVYLHKTVIAAEQLLVKILKRAKFLASNGENLFSTPSLKVFLFNRISKENFSDQASHIDGISVLDHFSNLDDYDIMSSIKVWCNHSDPILSNLCRSLLSRKLFKIEIQKNKFDEDKLEELRQRINNRFGTNNEDMDYMLFTGKISNSVYRSQDDRIKILFNPDTLVDITDASDILNISVLDKKVEKHYLCYPKEIISQ